MPLSLRAPRTAVATVVALLVTFTATLAVPDAAGQPSPSPSPSGSASASPEPGDGLRVELLNPSTGYDDPPKVSDRFDGVDGRYTIVAATTGRATSAIVEASIAPLNSDGTTFGNEIMIGELARVSPVSNVWQIDWDVPASIPDGTARIVVRAYVETAAGFAETGSDMVEVSVFHRDLSAQPLGAWETVDVTWPEQAGALGWYKPRVGAWRTLVDGTTSPGATHVSVFVSTTPVGEPPVFAGCGSTAVVVRSGVTTFSGRCTLDAVTLPSAVTAVAAVAEWRDPGSATRTLQAADVRIVDSYSVSPEDMSVAFTLPVRRAPAPAATCLLFNVLVTDDHGRLVLGANVDFHAAGPTDELILAGTGLLVPEPHTKEQTPPCPTAPLAPPPAPQQPPTPPPPPRTQGDHNVPGGVDVKHMENNQGTGLDGNTQPAGQTSFLVASFNPGITDLVAWVDDEEISSETDQRPADNDRLDPGEPTGHGFAQWLGAPAALSLDPLGGTAPAGTCFPYVVKARAGTAAMPRLNVDLHATGPDGDLDFCDPAGATQRRSPAAGAGANAHQAEPRPEAHHFSTTGPAAQHTEGETDAAGNFVVGLTSPVTGDSTVVAWIDGEPGADDDVQGGGEIATSGTVSWVSSAAEADLGFVNPSPYGGTTEGGGRGNQVPDAGGATDILVRVDMPGTAEDGVEVLLSTDGARTFSLLGTAERVASTDLYRLEWPIDLPDGSYTLRARIAGTSVTEDLSVVVGAGDRLPMLPNPSFETLEIRRPTIASGAPFSRRATTVAGRASPGAEGVDVYYTKTPAKDTPRTEDWILCGYADLDGSGSALQDFSTSCTLNGADQAAQVTGLAAITYDCVVDGCDADPSPNPPADGGPTPPREPGQKDTGDAVRVFGFEAQPLLAVEPPEAEAVTGDCRRFEAVLEDQTGQPIGDENVDLHLTGASSSAHFCRPVDGPTGMRAPDGGGHTTTGVDPATQLEAAHEGDGATLHTEGETLPDGRLVFGVTSEGEGDVQLTAWLDRDDDDLHADGEPLDTGLLHWVAPRGCSILGSEGPDVLRGTGGADVLCGLEGNDVVRGLGGADTVFAGAGADRVLGGAGRDTLRGARGRDRLNGGRGRDVCLGGPGRDRIARCETESRERPRVAPRRSGV